MDIILNFYFLSISLIIPPKMKPLKKKEEEEQWEREEQKFKESIKMLQ